MEEAMFLVRMNGSTCEKPSMKNKTSFHHKPKAQPQSSPWATSLHTAHCLCCDAPYLPKSAAHFSSPSVSTGCPCAPPLAAALSPCCSFRLPFISAPPRVCGAILLAAKQAQMFPYYKASSEPAHFNDLVHRFTVLQTRGWSKLWHQGGNRVTAQVSIWVEHRLCQLIPAAWIKNQNTFCPARGFLNLTSTSSINAHRKKQIHELDFAFKKQNSW